MQTTKKKPKKSKLVPTSMLSAPQIPKGKTLVLDEEIIPIVGIFGRSVEITYPTEFELIAGMSTNQSAVFHRSKMNIINAVRTRLQKITDKKFVIKKINGEYNRIWRIASKVKHSGGRIAGVSPYIREDGKSKSKYMKNGKYVGPVKPKNRGPKKTHKDGTPIVPQEAQLNDVQQ